MRVTPLLDPVLNYAVKRKVMITIVHTTLKNSCVYMLVRILSGDLVVELDQNSSMGCDTLKVSNTFLKFNAYK